MMTTTRTTIGLAILSLIGLVVSIAALWPQPEPVASAPPPQPGLSAKAESPGAPPRRAPVSARPGQSARPADTLSSLRETARPVRLTIESVDLDQRVRPVGVAAGGQMDLPDDPQVLGWYRFGAAPLDGDGGSVVVAGHLDSFRYGLGPLVRLRDVQVGAPVLVTLSTGRDATYVVRRVERFDRHALPGELFSRDGPELLRLITCGGAFDPDTGGYQENLVVTAAPVGERPRQNSDLRPTE